MEAIRSYLLARGLPPIPASLWAQFIYSVLETLAQAESELRQPVSWAAYCKKNGAFGKVRKRGRLSGTRIPDEDGITAELVVIARRYRPSAERRQLLRLLDVFIEGDPRVPDAQNTGKHSKRADFRASSGPFPDLEFVVEAKVLESEDHIASRLLGDKGMGCLTRRVPYTAAPVAGVLAYVVEHDRDWWIDRIADALPSRKASDIVKTSIDDVGPVVLSVVPRRRLSPLAVVGLAMIFEPLRARIRRPAAVDAGLRKR